MANEDTDGTIRPEVLERIQRENAELKAQIETLGGTVRDTKFLNDAYEHFKQAEGVADPYAVALQAVRDVTLKGVEGDELGGKLDSWLEGARSVFGTPASTPPPADEEPPAPVADTAPVPGFARPNPAADGAPVPPGSQILDTRSPEFEALVASGNKAEIQRLDKEGRINWKSQPQAG